MPNKKVYCSNCVFLSDESMVVSPRQYNSIRFRTESNKCINHRTDICISGMEKKIEIIEGPISQMTKLTVTVDDPFIMNANNNCIMYKETLFPRIINMLKKTLNIT